MHSDIYYSYRQFIYDNEDPPTFTETNNNVSLRGNCILYKVFYDCDGCISGVFNMLRHTKDNLTFRRENS